MAGFPTLKGSWSWPWIGSYCITSCITHRTLPTCQISLKLKEVLVDRQTYTQTDGPCQVQSHVTHKLGPIRQVTLLHKSYAMVQIRRDSEPEGWGCWTVPNTLVLALAELGCPPRPLNIPPPPNRLDPSIGWSLHNVYIYMCHTHA